MTVTRFAPSPTGRLHAGNIRTALVNWLLARQAGGRFLLRLDDTDAARSTDEAARLIREDLAWLGLTPDAEVRQSDRFPRYEAVLAELARQGHVYPAYETPEELELKRRVQQARGLPPLYDRAALALTDADRKALEAEGRTPHWRFRLDHSQPIFWDDGIRGPCRFDPAQLSDPVIRRADGSWLYMLPSVIDDIDLGLTDIVRGEDHVTNSALQLQMFAALGSPPPRLAHLALLTGSDAALSKRLGSTGAGQWQAAGIEPLAVCALLARLGTSEPVMPVASLADLVTGFSLAHFGRAPARFDEQDLATLSQRTLPLLPAPSGADPALWDAVKANLTTRAELAIWQQIVTGPMQPVLTEPDYLQVARQTLETLDWGPDIWSRWIGELKPLTGRKGKPLFLPLRLALTGLDHGPEMAALLPLIGRSESLTRLTVK